MTELILIPFEQYEPDFEQAFQFDCSKLLKVWAKEYFGKEVLWLNGKPDSIIHHFGDVDQFLWFEFDNPEEAMLFKLKWA